jgi:N-acetylmuramoyl-L-alanine amidase
LPRRVTLAGVLVALAVGVAAMPAPDADAANPALSSFTVSGSPFAQDFAPLPTQSTLTVVLNRPAVVSLTIRKPNGTLVRRIAARVAESAGSQTWTWDGSKSAGGMAPDGAYVARLVVTTSRGSHGTERPVRKGLPAIYPANPGAIVVVVDPGHGGRFSGAANGPYLEKNFNLDIGLQLGALLRRAGVQVVMTRTTDVAVNEPKSDLNGDGVLNRYDDDLARTDVANEARGDIAVHVHNNASRDPAAHGTEAWTAGDRTWTPQGLDLAADVLAGVAGNLDSYRSPAFAPSNAGVNTGWYYYMGPYDPPFLIRAALMTSVLSESLFVSNSSDLDALKRPDVRLSIAAGIYLGIADYLNARQYGLGYELVSAPDSVAAGAHASYTVRVTNRGNVTSAGWTLTLATVPAVPLYDGSGAHGTTIGSAAIPDGLAPGASAEVTVNAAAPAAAGDWLVKSDVVLEGGGRMSDAGIAPLQVALATTIGP